MNVKTANEIQALNSADLRSYAKEIGVTRKADDTKATLAARVITKAAELTAEIIEAIPVVEVTPIEATTEETLELLADVAAAAAPAPRKGICNVCNRRKAAANQLCTLCSEEGEWENEHSDRGHEDANGETDAACWICHPELNKATKGARVAVTGRSRAGMVIFAKGTYLHKSALVAEAIKAAGGTAKVKAAKDGSVTDLTGEVNGVEITMGWNGNAFAYGERSLINGKQVRNVAAALRLIAAAAKN